MKNSGSILATLLGGALIGAAATICMRKRGMGTHLGGKEMHQAIIDKLSFIQGHIDECCCMMGGCKCSDDNNNGKGMMDSMSDKSSQGDGADATTK